MSAASRFANSSWMNGCEMGDNGRIASLIGSAAAPTVTTDSPRLCAMRPKHRSVFDSHIVPTAGQQAVAATAIKVAPASMTKSEGPPGAEPKTAIMRVISSGPRVESENRHWSASLCYYRLRGISGERVSDLAENLANAGCNC